MLLVLAILALICSVLFAVSRSRKQPAINSTETPQRLLDLNFTH
jgi:hypothetical protein